MVDLTRAKTILILAFLLLNSYLGYQVWHKSEIYLSYLIVTTEEVEEVLGQLALNNYQVTAALPRQVQTMSLLSVRAKDVEEEKFVEALFAPPPLPLREEKEGETIYTYQEEFLVFPGKGKVNYRRPEPVGALEEVRELQRRGDEFLKGKGLMPGDARFDAVYSGIGNANVVVFTQQYEGFSLYTSYIKLYFAGGDLTGFDYFWLEPLEFSGESRYVLPVTQALLRFLDIQGPARRPEEITAISLGYFSREYDAQKWDVAPVWRLATGTGRIIYINAFSGEEEKH
jgi:regulatory protein YycI of two-component signal transduction system YycFG